MLQICYSGNPDPEHSGKVAYLVLQLNFWFKRYVETVHWALTA